VAAPDIPEETYVASVISSLAGFRSGFRWIRGGKGKGRKRRKKRHGGSGSSGCNSDRERKKQRKRKRKRERGEGDRVGEKRERAKK